MILRTTNLLLLVIVTALSAINVYDVTTEKNQEQLLFEKPATTGEFPIESFVQIRAELTLELSQLEKPENCHPNTTCENSSIQFPKVMASSGVIVWSSENASLVLTAGHSCDNSVPEPIKVLEEKFMLTTGVGIEAEGTVLKIHAEHDLCMLVVNKNIGPAMEYTNEQVPLHTNVKAMASPMGLGSSYAIPVFEGRYFGDVSSNFSTYGFPSAPGSSGGPVFNADGKIIGIITAVANGFHHFSIVTTVAQTSSFLDKNIAEFVGK